MQYYDANGSPNLKNMLKNTNFLENNPDLSGFIDNMRSTKNVNKVFVMRMSSYFKSTNDRKT